MRLSGAYKHLRSVFGGRGVDLSAGSGAPRRFGGAEKMTRHVEPPLMTTDFTSTTSTYIHCAGRVKYLSRVPVDLFHRNLDREVLGNGTWKPRFASVSGACRAPDDGLGIRASVSGSERANGAGDEPCRSRCVQNSGGFIIWRAAYLRTSAPPKPPASHGRTTVSRTLFSAEGICVFTAF